MQARHQAARPTATNFHPHCAVETNIKIQRRLSYECRYLIIINYDHNYITYITYLRLIYLLIYTLHHFNTDKTKSFLDLDSFWVIYAHYKT